MPIERDGKHWCDPASETPDENGLFYCTCGTVWTYNPDERLWSLYVAPDPEPGTGEEPIAAAAAVEAEPAAVSPAVTKRKTRTGKAGAE
jgi:hypothetical protein